MYWKKFKNLPSEAKSDETYYILGLDLGNETSALAYYDSKSKSSEVIDISGGYGKPSIPTAMQYISETREWVFGEYALLNKNSPADVIVSDLVERLGRKEYIEIESRPVSLTNILSLFLKNLISNVKNINPRAEIAGILAATPSYLSEDAKDELLLAFKNAGFDKEVIALVPDRECIFSHYYSLSPAKHKNIMLLDFGSRELRGGIYQLGLEQDPSNANSLNTLFDNNIGVNCINNAVLDLFTEYYCEQMSERQNKLTDTTKSQILSFTYQHRDLLFQKNISKKPVRLYFNFAYPPFQKSISKNDVDQLLEPFVQEFNFFLARLLGAKKRSPLAKIPTQNIDAVLCTGGGFEMLWAREIISGLFSESDVVFYKNSKSVTAQGAALVAAIMLDAADGRRFAVSDHSQIKSDIGLMVKKDKRKKFVPVIERNSFWWQSHSPKLVIVDEPTSKPINIELFRRDSDGDISLLGDIKLNGLPDRPRGVTKLKLNFRFENSNELVATVSDCGFGELFPGVDCEKSACFKLC